MAARHISVVDLSDFSHKKDEIRKALLRAAEYDGVFYVSNHGIPQHLIDSMFGRARNFFQRDEAIKATYSFDKPRNAGWESKAQVCKYDCWFESPQQQTTYMSIN